MSAIELLKEQRKINPLNLKAVSAFRRKVQKIAKRTSECDAQSVIALDIIATRMGMGPLKFKDQQ